MAEWRVRLAELSHQTCRLSDAPRVPATYTGVREKKQDKKKESRRSRQLLLALRSGGAREVTLELPDLFIPKTPSVCAPAAVFIPRGAGSAYNFPKCLSKEPPNSLYTRRRSAGAGAETLGVFLC